MRLICLYLIGTVFASGCMHLQAEKTITLVGSGALDTPQMERLRAFAEKELHVPVRVVKEPSLAGPPDFQTLEKAARKTKTADDVAYIVIAELQDERHMEAFEESGIAVVNVKPLRTGASDEVLYQRTRRMVMRSAAFVFGLEPTPDPFCVTRDYRDLNDLDRMGNNYSPPWQDRYAKEAAKRGLEPLVPKLDRFPQAK